MGTRTLSIQVSVGVIQTLTVDKKKVVLGKDDTEQVKLTASYPDDTTKDVTGQAAWTTSSAAIAEVYQGKITAVGPGTATVSATYEGKTVTVSVEVDQAQTLSVDPRLLVLAVGETAEIKLTSTDSAGNSSRVTSDAVWSSSSVKIADVVDGKVTGLSNGRATITARYSNKSVSIPVDVDTLKYLKTDVVQLVMNKGETVQVTAIATYMDGTEQNVTKPALWTTSRLLVADVKDGLIKATGSGKATIYVTYGGKKTPIVVTVR